MDERALQARIDQGKQLAGLKDHPAWPLLKRILAEQRDRELRRFTRPEVLDDQLVHFGRGRIGAFDEFVEIVEHAEQNAINATRKKVAQQQVRSEQLAHG